ncbi:MAG TPA: hypothetical protein PLC59_03940 [Bacteroidales bacterium]|nr:hypothetical protein [Bacteroidales bacterium]HPS46815.1 hypothetical protein [Bacteroidales bacterium]HQI45185.1 hypothetical protein [Bacteroidales bacterium]
MKKIIVLFTLMLPFFYSCGPSKEDQEKENRKADSLMQTERNTAVENANKLLSDTLKTDSLTSVN